MLKYQYKDCRGLPIPDDRILDLLTECDLTEQKVIDFFGEDVMRRTSYIYSFLCLLSDVRSSKDFKRVEFIAKDYGLVESK